MSSPFTSDRASLLSGLRTAGIQQQYSNVGQAQNYYQQQQQQMQLAFYQQQQFELAQQQVALELQLQLEQMRLQNIALQEQIILGQAHHHAQAQAEATLHHRMEERNVYTAAPKSAAVGGRFALAQGGVLAERAMARRQAQEDSPTVNSPSIQSRDTFSRSHHSRHSSTSSYLSSSTTPRDPNSPTPALILSKPGEAFPVSNTPSESGSEKQLGHKHSDSDSSISTGSCLSSFSHSRGASEGDCLDSPPSEVVSFDSSHNVTSPKAKLNPFSSVFIPAITTPLSPPLATAVPSNVYRPPRAGSPTSAIAMARKPTVTSGAAAFRQPKGPPAHAEDLESQNFNTRLRKRAITNIKALGIRATSPPSSPNLGAGMGSFGELKSPGLMTLLQATKVREERAARAC